MIADTLSPAEYRDEMERTLARAIVRADEAKGIYAPPLCAQFDMYAEGLGVAVRLLGGYGMTPFDLAWAERTRTAKGAPRWTLDAWASWPGGPAIQGTFRD